MGNLSFICEDRADWRKKWDDTTEEKIFRVCHIRTYVRYYGDLVRARMTFNVARNYKNVDALSLYHLFSSTMNLLMLIIFKMFMVFYLKLNAVF